ncbi:hypothetical protein ABT173_20050 [Streptomyces sp. NPDC001795]|uniref:hypothetical protein n=1 Tax=unclassified Streptomyces TaxID=2593676 RepID=UPI0033285875
MPTPAFVPDDFEVPRVLLGDGFRLGCVYIYPSREDERTTDVRSCVSADRAELDGPLRETVAARLSAHWPFAPLRYR